MRTKLNILAMAVLMLLVVVSAFGDWPEDIDSNNYTGSWRQIYTDIMKAIAPLQGAITDTNISATADIDGSKLEDSTLSFDKNFYAPPYMTGLPGDSAKKYAYGNAKIVDADSIILPDAKISVEIEWDDSSEVGNPAFGSAPRLIQVSYYCAVDTICWRNESRDLTTRNVAPCFLIRQATSSKCTVDVYCPEGSDTLWTWKARLLWEAME